MIEIIKNKDVPAFKHGTQYSAGYDLYCMDEDFTLEAGQTMLVHTGIKVNMMETNNTCALVLPRSGLSLKTNLRVANSPGLIDKDYRGEICVILHNIGNYGVKVLKFDRIAQLMFINYEENNIKFVEKFKDETDRGSGGFGSTGVNG